VKFREKVFRVKSWKLGLESLGPRGNTQTLGFNIWLTRYFLPPLISAALHLHLGFQLPVPQILRPLLPVTISQFPVPSSHLLAQLQRNCSSGHINLAQDLKMSECLGKLVQRQAAVEICPLSVLQPELPSDLCPTLRSGQHVANNKKSG